MNTSARVAAILIFGILTASIANAARSKPLPWVLDFSKSIQFNKDVAAAIYIPFDEVKKVHRQYTAAFIDARSPDLYEKGHLEGAYLVPSTAIEAHMGPVYQNIAPTQLVIVYCDGGNCEASHQVAEFLQASGFKNVRILHEGWELLGKGELPIVSGPEPMPGFIDPTLSPESDAAGDPAAAGTSDADAEGGQP